MYVMQYLVGMPTNKQWLMLEMEAQMLQVNCTERCSHHPIQMTGNLSDAFSFW